MLTSKVEPKKPIKSVVGPKPESPRSPEHGEELFKSYLAAEHEVEAIMQEINSALSSAQDQVETERLILQTYANRLDQAARKARELLDTWLAHVRKLSSED